jgi:hypothetical protein
VEHHLVSRKAGRHSREGVAPSAEEHPSALADGSSRFDVVAAVELLGAETT